MQRRSVAFVLRSSTFLLWSVIGASLTYGAIYLITPFALVLIAAPLAAASALKSLGSATRPEILGLFAGPGVFCLIVATRTEDPSTLTVIGGAWVSVILIAYLAFGSARCSTST